MKKDINSGTTIEKIVCTLFHFFWHRMTGGYLHETDDGKKWVFTCKKCSRRWDA